MGELFDAAVAGDGKALAELHALVRSFARTVCRGGGPAGSPDLDWEDVAQEAWRKLLAAGLAQYSGRGTERSYLFSVVKATVIGMGRSAGRRRLRETAVAQGAPTTSDPSGALDVRAILAALPSECRTLIERAFFDDATYPELAEELRMAESSVRAKLSRCLRRARDLASGGERR